MRVRAAIVNINRASGLRSFFDHAVDRHLAFVVGTGHSYVDLETVAREHGYELKAFDSNEDDVANYWIAVRTDLIKEAEQSGPDNVFFDTRVKGLGPITIGTDSEYSNEDENALTFYTSDMQTLVAYNQNDRVKVGSNLGPVDKDDFVYNEYLFNVEALKN